MAAQIPLGNEIQDKFTSEEFCKDERVLGTSINNYKGSPHSIEVEVSEILSFLPVKYMGLKIIQKIVKPFNYVREDTSGKIVKSKKRKSKRA